MERNEKQLVSELDSYIQNGYIDIDSFDNPDDEAAAVLTKLHFKNEELCKIYCKRILVAPDVGDTFLDSLCLSHLFDLDKEYSIDYVQRNVNTMSAPVLGAAMDGLCQYSNTSFRAYFTLDLINKIKKRYREIVITDFQKDMLKNSYELFSTIF